MLVALYRPSEGDIYVDGVPLSALDIGWWRRQLGVVEQDPGGCEEGGGARDPKGACLLGRLGYSSGRKGLAWHGERRGHE